MSDYPQMAVSHIVRTRHLYFAQRDTTPACFGPLVTILKLLFLKYSSQTEHSNCRHNHVDAYISYRKQEQCVEHFIHFLGGSLTRCGVGRHDDGTSGGKWADCCCKGGCGDCRDQLYVVDSGKALADFCGNWVQGWHDNCGGGAYPGQDSGGCCHDRGCGMLGHKGSQGIGDQVDAA